MQLVAARITLAKICPIPAFSKERASRHGAADVVTAPTTAAGMIDSAAPVNVIQLQYFTVAVTARIKASTVRYS
jgi:hypothetical protein